jgi:hypothetical protein
MVSKNIVSAINEIYNTGGGGGLPWVYEPSGSDDTTNIVNMLTAYGICQLVSGTYSVTNLQMPSGSTLKGVGKSTVIRLSGTDSTSGYAIMMASNCTVSDMRIQGSDSSITLSDTLVNRHGILWEGTYSVDSSAPKRGTVTRCYIEHFKGGAITLRNTGTPVDNCINVSDCFIMDCRAGINVSYSSEFNRFENIHVYGCYYGCVNNGGNNTFVGCSFSSNTVGFIMGSIDEGITLSNTQHGSAIGCVINHSHANNGDGIRISGGVNGFIFSDCQLFYSKIDITNAKGIVFANNNYGAQTITVSGGGVILFNGCMFGSTPTKNITDNTDVHFANCYVRSDGSVIS